MAAYTAPGWYGKLPSTGDFLHHRLSEQQITPWNHWFQQGLMHWHQQDDAVTANFLRAPVWNFVLPITPTRQQVQMGCLLPSCDRVGRAWPLLALHSFPLSRIYPLLSLSYVLVWLAAVSLPFFHEPFSWRGLAGIAVIILGVTCLVLEE